MFSFVAIKNQVHGFNLLTLNVNKYSNTLNVSKYSNNKLENMQIEKTIYHSKKMTIKMWPLLLALEVIRLNLVTFGIRTTSKFALEFSIPPNQSQKPPFHTFSNTKKDSVVSDVPLENNPSPRLDYCMPTKLTNL